MNGIDVLRMQLQGSCDLIASNTAAAEPHWTARAFPSASLPGFVLWHCARIIDWGVQTVIRDVPEVAAAEAWRERVRHDLGAGFGLTAEQADEAARSVGAADVSAYAAVVCDTVMGWLDTVRDGDLDAPADLRKASERHPLYATPAAWEEVAGLDGLPRWQVLSRPCIVHIRMHIGELGALRAALDQATASA